MRPRACACSRNRVSLSPWPPASGTPPRRLSPPRNDSAEPMSILVDRNTRLLVQGITGREGSFHAKAALDYGTNLVAGVTPGRGGTKFEEKVPVFNTVEAAVRETGANVSIIFVP